MNLIPGNLYDDWVTSKRIVRPLTSTYHTIEDDYYKSLNKGLMQIRLPVVEPSLVPITVLAPVSGKVLIPSPTSVKYKSPSTQEPPRQKHQSGQEQPTQKSPTHEPPKQKTPTQEPQPTHEPHRQKTPAQKHQSGQEQPTQKSPIQEPPKKKKPTQEPQPTQEPHSPKQPYKRKQPTQEPPPPFQEKTLSPKQPPSHIPKKVVPPIPLTPFLSKKKEFPKLARDITYCKYQNDVIYENDAICFDDNPKDTFFEFSNFYDKAELKILGTTYKTVEHYFQSEKFNPNREPKAEKHKVMTRVYNEIMKEDMAHMARARGVHAGYSQWIRSTWEADEIGVMERGILDKFRDDKLKDLLLSTTGKRLVYHTDDYFFGDEMDGTGQNILGNILMYIRYDIGKSEYEKDKDIMFRLIPTLTYYKALIRPTPYSHDNNPIFFYDEEKYKPFHEFSNHYEFAGFEEKYQEKTTFYFTAEHYYQAKIRDDPKIIENIINEYSVKKMLELYKNMPIKKEMQVHDRDIMADAILLKFTKSANSGKLKKLLLDTGDRPLIYHNQATYFGNGLDGSGRNMLGVILMELRKSLRLTGGGNKIDYYHKYLKYKNKYILLRSINEIKM